MKMSDGVEWAIHCVVFLAMIPSEAAMPAKALAQYHGVSESYLLKHLQALSAHHILQALPGPKGGYRLARPAETITFWDIVEALEGSEPVFRCTEIRQRGPVKADPAACRLPCAIYTAMRQAEQAWQDSLRGQTIAAIVEHLGTTLSPASQAASALWVQENARQQKS